MTQKVREAITTKPARPKVDYKPAKVIVTPNGRISFTQKQLDTLMASVEGRRSYARNVGSTTSEISRKVRMAMDDSERPLCNVALRFAIKYKLIEI